MVSDFFEAEGGGGAKENPFVDAAAAPAGAGVLDEALFEGAEKLNSANPDAGLACLRSE